MPTLKLRPVSALILASGLLLAAASEAQLPATYTLDDKKLLWAEAVSYVNGTEFDYDLLRFDHEAAALACDKYPYDCVGNKAINKQSFRLPLPAVPLYLKDTVNNQPNATISRPVLDPASKTWVMVYRVSTRPSDFPKNINPQKWLDQYAMTALPDLNMLKTDSALTTRRELSRIHDTAALNAALKAGIVNSSNINIKLANGSTLLRRAAIFKEAEMIETLLKNGARADVCTPLCPLNSAIQTLDIAIIKKLLDAGANPNGGNDVYRPLTVAALLANKDIVDLLLYRGANPLLPQKEVIFGGDIEKALLQYAPADNPAFTSWLQTKIDQALEKSGKYTWSAWIEQNGQRTKLTDNAVIKLKTTPFKIIMHINPEHSFRLICAEDKSLFEHAKDIHFRTDTLSPFKVGASADDSKYLSCGKIAQERGKWLFDGATKELSYAEKADEKTGTQRTKGTNGNEYSYNITEFINDRNPVPLAQYKGKELAMMIGTVPRSGMGADYFRPASFTIKFQ
ncbi:ankyrin repeat domain-containing protein [Undibacterium sp. Ji42W]|uniref:ankyrin repeat domain-containing protein n=1 Tax=Undibacterium sp. Ji42W TaxID=3413039 RepID=UPI003BF40CBF